MAMLRFADLGIDCGVCGSCTASWVNRGRVLDDEAGGDVRGAPAMQRQRHRPVIDG